jgi:hypothetical protein
MFWIKKSIGYQAMKPPAVLASCFLVCRKEFSYNFLWDVVLKVLLLYELRLLLLHFEEPTERFSGACFQSSPSVVQFFFS